jgi:hypothetical protein
MSSLLGTLGSLLKKNVWVLAAFLIPMAIRSVPEILSWPYILGIDTVRFIPIIQSGAAFSQGLLSFVHFHLFYSLATLFYYVMPDAILIVKVFGPLILAFVSVTSYLYARRGLGWSGFKSFLVALLVATYFVSLRNSWDLYSQSFALIFLLAALIVFKSSSSSMRYPAVFVFMILTVLGHELVAVILFFVFGLEAVRFLIKKSRRDFLFLVIMLCLSCSLFLFSHYSQSSGIVVIPIADNGLEPSIALSLLIAGLMVYCYGLILPFAILGFVGLKDWVLRYWVILCVVIPLITMLFPMNPLYFWDRWVYLLVYPLLFFAVHGLDKFWRFWSIYKGKILRLVPKIFAIAYVVLLLALSGFYLAASPNNQFSYFSASNPFLAYIPSSMLQNALPIEDNPAFVSCLEWLNTTSVGNSVIVEHYVLYDLICLYVKNRLVIPVYEDPFGTSIVEGMVNSGKKALDNGTDAVYSVYWTRGNGWYNIPALPPEFKEVHRSGIMAIYLFDPTA